MEEEFVNETGTEGLTDAPATGYDEGAGSIESLVLAKYTRSKAARHSDEQRWLRAYRNYRGIYGPDVQFTETEKSRVFVKVTKGKVLAAYGQITDVLFGSEYFPIDIQPTRIPDGIAESVHFSLQNSTAMPEGSMPEAPELTELKPGDTRQTIAERIGSLDKKLDPVLDRLQEGPGTTPEKITVHPAAVAASKMKKKIHDQLEETNARKKTRSFSFELCLLGHGVMKGPYGVDKEYPDWDEEGEYTPLHKFIPELDYVSVWNFYPDPDAANMDDSEFCIERHKMSRSKLRALKKRPFFRERAVDHAINLGENYKEEWWESHLEESEGGDASRIERFEVIEFWGNMDTEKLKEHNLTIPPSMKDLDEVSVNAWVCNGQLIRLVLNPYKPAYLPYYAVPYEVNPYSFFGIGVAENMQDTQLLMNGFMRLAVDNAALSGNLVFEVDSDNLKPNTDLNIYPGKVFERTGGAPGQAIFGTKFPNVSNENMQLFDKARVLADEQTGIPSFSHGQTGVSGVGRTSSGISMLMGAASGSIRTVVKNIDDYLLSPVGKALFHFNMQFDYDPDIRGDLEVKARGTESLMANEVRSQRLMQFLSLVQNPQDAAFARRDYILREIAKSLDLDPEKVVNSLADAAIQAELMAKMQQTAQPPEQEGEVPAVPSVADTQGSGDGNIGVGQAPLPEEQGFSGNEQQAMI